MAAIKQRGRKNHAVSQHEDVEEVILSPETPVEVQRQAIRGATLYAWTGLVLGGICVILGVLLFVFGITGSTTWVVKVLGLTSEVTDAAPGALLFVVGAFLIFVTRLKIRIRRDD